MPIKAPCCSSSSRGTRAAEVGASVEAQGVGSRGEVSRRGPGRGSEQPVSHDTSVGKCRKDRTPEFTPRPAVLLSCNV